LTHDEQLVWERRAGKPAAAAAFGSALFGIAALAVGTSLQQKQPLGDAVDELVLDHKHPGLYLAGAVLQALSLILLTGALVYLYRATRYRRPQIQRPIYYLAMVLPTAVGILTVVSAIEHLNAADRVIPKLPLPPKAAIDLANHEALSGGPALAGYLASAAAILLAFTIGMIAVNARRAGLLSSFMGILGVIVGVLFVLGGLLQAPPIVQYFWITALGLIFIDRWPGQVGRGPAWDSGEAIPWPTAADLRAAQGAGGGDGGGDGAGRDGQGGRRGRPAAPEPEADGDAYEPDAGATPHPRSKKRKRKRRR
jgi:hypothetical protein